MTDLPDPPPVNSPFGSPGSGWDGSSGPFDSPTSGGGGRRKLVVVLLVASAVAIAVLVASVFLRDDSSSDTQTSDQASDEPVSSEPVATVPLPEATPAPSTTPEASPTSTQAPPESAPSTEPAAVPADVDPTAGSLFEGDRVGPVVDEIAAARGADPLRVLRMLVYPEYAFGEVQDPSIPENVDEYRWRGELEAPEPVRLIAVDDLEAALFTADEVDWSAIAPLVAGAPGAVQIPDGEVTHVIVERPLPFSADVRMRVFVNGARDSGYVDADANGVIIAIDGQAVGDAG